MAVRGTMLTHLVGELHHRPMNPTQNRSMALNTNGVVSASLGAKAQTGTPLQNISHAPTITDQMAQTATVAARKVLPIQQEVRVQQMWEEPS